MTETKIYPCRDSMATSLAAQVANELTRVISVRGKATLAVPGGETPLDLFAELSEKEIEWEYVTIILTDECYVPETSQSSNARRVKEKLLQGPAAKARFIPFYREGLTAAEALDVLNDELVDVLPADVLILGMGEDMHTASLFADAENIDEALGLWAPFVMLFEDKDAEAPHITLTAPVLERAQNAHIAIQGQEKRQALRKAKTIDLPKEAPIRVALDRARTTTTHYAD